MERSREIYSGAGELSRSSLETEPQSRFRPVVTLYYGEPVEGQDESRVVALTLWQTGNALGAPRIITRASEDSKADPNGVWERYRKNLELYRGIASAAGKLDEGSLNEFIKGLNEEQLNGFKKLLKPIFAQQSRAKQMQDLQQGLPSLDRLINPRI